MLMSQVNRNNSSAFSLYPHHPLEISSVDRESQQYVQYLKEKQFVRSLKIVSAYLRHFKFQDFKVK